MMNNPNTSEAVGVECVQLLKQITVENMVHLNEVYKGLQSFLANQSNNERVQAVSQGLL